jgi:hypothetical protein
MSTDDVADAANHLYGLPLSEFRAARNATAKALAKAGRRDAAAEVRALPKPTLAAWAINQVARRRPELVDGLLTRGHALRDAQARALSGDAGSMRATGAALDAALRDAVEATLATLAATGSATTGVQRLRVEATLRACATQGEAGATLRAGALTTDLSPAGLGLDGIDVEPVPSAPAERSSPEAARLARQARQAVAEAQRRREEATRQRHHVEETDAQALEAEARAARLLAQIADAERAPDARRDEGRSSKPPQ